MEGNQPYTAADSSAQPELALAGARGLPARRAAAVSLPTALTLGALLLYIFMRLIALPDFPIYFFTDEAAQTMHAYDLLRNDLRSPQGELLPVYFQNGPQYNLSISVYLQALPTFLLGKSVWVTRGTAALATLLAAASVGLILDQVFRSRTAWMGVMVLSLTPAWFLHSRTAFETALAASFYAAFLGCYLIYRQGHPRALFGAVLFGALAFYTYTPMRVVMLVSALLLFLMDLRFHLRQWRTLLLALGLALMLALPLLRFELAHPEATFRHLQLLGSYWLEEKPLTAKLAAGAVEYLRGLNPAYWYFPQVWDLARHTMKGYGHLLLPFMPLGLLGIILGLRNIRDPRWRVLLAAVLAAPSGAALVRLGITRALVMVIPMALLTALAAEHLLDWLRRRARIPHAALALGAFCVLCAANLYMLRDALVNGPLWYSDYGLTGMQYGARQLFAAVSDHLKAHPKDSVIVSPAWSNGTDVVARYFFDDPLPFELGSPRAFFDAERPLSADTLVVMLPDEFDSLPCERFAEVTVENVLRYPDGRPGFFFTRLEYVENVQALVAREEAAHHRRLIAHLDLDGQPVQLTYPRLDIGAPEALFDRQPQTMVRSWEINPLNLDLEFREPRMLRGLTLRVGGPPQEILVSAWKTGEDAPVTVSRMLDQSTVVRDVSMDLPGPLLVERLFISVANKGEPEDANVHLWEVTLR